MTVSKFAQVTLGICLESGLAAPYNSCVFAEKASEMFKTLLITTALASAPLAAMAQDGTGSFDWTGPYAGIFVGNDSVSDTFSGQVDDYDYDGAFLNGFEAIASGNGSVGGVQLGYRYQTGNVVLGISAEYAKSNAKAEEVLYNSNAGYDYGGSVELKTVGSLRASFGYSLGNTLISVSAGPARASVTQTVIDDYEFDSETWNSSLSGFVAGVGVSYAINDHLILDGEVSMLSLERDNYVESEGYAYKTDLSSTQVRVGLSYKF